MTPEQTTILDHKLNITSHDSEHDRTFRKYYEFQNWTIIFSVRGLETLRDRFDADFLPWVNDKEDESGSLFEKRQRDSSNGKIEFVHFVVDQASQWRHSQVHHFASHVTFTLLTLWRFGAKVSCRGSDDVIQFLKWNVFFVEIDNFSWHKIVFAFQIWTLRFQICRKLHI